jgi:glycosyl transferase family 21
VDNPQDKALPAVEKWRKAHPELPVVIDFLRAPGDDCTLYCSALHQAIASLDPEIEIVAFANADTMPHPQWLRALAAPLTLPAVGAVTGNRWYLPQSDKWGTLVRYVQNASALVVMYLLNLLWGGSLAIKRSIFANPLFLHRLRHVCCEDQAIHEALRANHERVFFTPAVLMVNREECTLPWGFRFMRRQLAWMCLSHQRWHELVVHAGLLAVVGLLTPVAGGVALALRQWMSLGWLLAGVGAFFAVNLFTLWRTHVVVMQRVQTEQGDVGHLPLWLLPKLFVAMPMTLYVHLAAVFSACWLRQVEWRGIRYTVVSPRSIKLVAYQPYQQAAGAQQEKLSL